MLVNQISGILIPAMKQAFGETAITATNLEGLVSEGNKLVSSAEASVLDKLSYGLLDRIYMVAMGVRKYKADTNSVIREYETYGNIVSGKWIFGEFYICNKKYVGYAHSDFLKKYNEL